jgi:RNA methyltransferase, TrmH family
LISKQQIKHLRLLQQKKYRDKFNSFIVEGVKIINEAIQNDSLSINMLICTSKSKNHINIAALSKDTSLIEVTAKEFDKITSQNSPQEVLAVIRKPQFQIPKANLIEDISFAIDKLRDPGNFGTIIRLADWFGVKQIFCSTDTVDCFNPKVVQSSMGAIFRIDIHYVDLKKFLNNIKQNKLQSIYATSLSGSDLFKTKLSKPAVILLGNESGGLSEDLIVLSDQNLLIPNYSMSQDKGESLNVSMAAAIICAEIRRQTS